MKESSLALRFEMAAYFKDMIDNLNYIRYGIFKLKTIFNKHIVLKLPIEDGYNLFYVTRGEIILKEKYRKLNDKDIEDFIIFVYLASLNILCYPVYNTKE